MTKREISSITVAGCGAVGSTLALAIQRSGYPLSSILTSKFPDSIPFELVGSVPALPFHAVETAPIGSCLFLTVPDDQIYPMATRLAKLGTEFWNGKSAVHCSGGVDSSALEPLSQLGAEVAAFHPVQTFRAGDGPDRFRGITVSLEGDQNLIRQLSQLATDLDAEPVLLDRDQKAALHIAAVYLSNYLVVLGSLAEDLLRQSVPGVDLSALQPLLIQTADNVMESSPDAVLTGPVSRGDIRTLQMHLELLGRNGLSDEVYRVLGSRAADLAERSGRLSGEQAERVRLLMHP